MTTRITVLDRPGVIAAGGVVAGVPPTIIGLYLILVHVLAPLTLMVIALAGASSEERIEVIRAYLSISTADTDRSNDRASAERPRQ